METHFPLAISDYYISRVVISLELFYLFLQLRNLLVDMVILNFHKPLMKVERIVLQVVCTSSVVFINHITHILVADLAI